VSRRVEPGPVEKARTELAPLALSHRPVARLAQLMAGLSLYGLSMALMLRARLGVDPWDVLHQGVARRTGASFGLVVAVVGALVLLIWIPLRQRPGVGTVLNVVVVAVAVELGLAVIPAVESWAVRVPLLVSGVVLNGLATAGYVGSRLGAGPRDGLMTGLHARTGRSVRRVRTSIEVAVLLTGWLLGGNVGVGTVLYAVSIGPLTQFFLRKVTYREPSPPGGGDAVLGQDRGGRSPVDQLGRSSGARGDAPRTTGLSAGPTRGHMRSPR
jgi:uncharacterized membrane protein YczE